jgi:hypothetical protein
LLFPLILAAVFGAYLYVDFRSANSCTTLIPDSATASFFANSTVAGVSVSYGNGSSSFFLAGKCPQPVHQNLYNAISVVAQDPRFIRDENGSQFTVDPIYSTNTPVNVGNGSEFNVLVFNRLNLSDPIFPCNMSTVFSKPIAQIDVLIPVSSNGTNVYSNDTITEYSGSQLRFNCQPETGVAILAKTRVIQPFQVGGFSFKLVSNETNFVGTNGTSFPGYDYAFNITYVGNPSQSFTQQVVFTWPSAGALNNNQAPKPFVKTSFNSYVVLRWFTNSTGLYLVVTTLA